MEIFNVFSMNGIENYPAAGEIFLENFILKVSQTHFPKDLYPKGGPMPPPPLGFAQGGHKFFKGGQCPPLGGGGGGVKYPAHANVSVKSVTLTHFTQIFVYRN